jgi:hypothetical protein
MQAIKNNEWSIEDSDVLLRMALDLNLNEPNKEMIEERLGAEIRADLDSVRKKMDGLGHFKNLGMGDYLVVERRVASKLPECQELFGIPTYSGSPYERAKKISEKAKETEAHKTESAHVDRVEELLENTSRAQKLIQEYFSDNLQRDETPIGAMRRNQIRKELLDFIF